MPLGGGYICRFLFPEQSELPINGNMRFVAKEWDGEIR